MLKRQTNRKNEQAQMIICSNRFNNFVNTLFYGYFTLFFLVNFTVVYAQDLDSLKSGSRHPRVDSSITFLASAKPNTVKIEYHPSYQDTVFVREYQDTIGQFYFNISHLGSEINIQYLNDSIWFLYGTRVVYAYYPFILKTINSGKSWQTIMQSWPRIHNQPPMYKNKFHMFDVMNGIWVIGLFDNKIKYRVTNDGGYTWKNLNIRTKYGIDLKNGSTVLDIKYFDNDAIQISIKGYLKKDGKWTTTLISPIYKSIDLGKKFRKLDKAKNSL